MSDPRRTSILQNPDPHAEEFSINFKEIWKVIIRRWNGIVLIITLSILWSWFTYSQLPPEYHASSLLMIKQSHGVADWQLGYGAGAAGGGASGGGISTQLSTDIALLKSTTISEHAVRELYNSRRRDSLEFFGKRRFFTSLSILLNPRDYLLQRSVHPLRSFSEKDFSNYSLALQSRLRVLPVPDTNLLNVSVASPFADEALFLTNTICRVYKDADKRWNSEKYTQSMKYINELLKEQKVKVDDADNDLINYQEHNELTEGTADSQQLLQKISEIDTKYNETISEYNIVRNNLNFLEKKLSDADKSLSARVSKNVSAQLGAIQDEIKSAERAYVLILRDKKADDPEVQVIRKRLDLVKSRYEQLSRSKIAGELSYSGQAQRYNFDLISEKLQTERKLNELVFSSNEWIRRKQAYEVKLSKLPKKQQTYFKLKRQQDVVAKTYLFLQEKLEETSLLLGSEVGKVVIVGDAIIPVSPEKPPLVKKLLIALLTGVLLASIFALVSEFLDDTLNEASYFKDIGLTMLALVPLVGPKKKTVNVPAIKEWWLDRWRPVRDVVLVFVGRRKGKQAVKLPPPAMPKITDNLSSEFSESFRTLRTALDYSRIDTSLKAIMVTGTAMSEGKSTICANLGMAYALTGKKTLIIDCDLRRASVHNKFDCKREPGLSDYLFSVGQNIQLFFQTTHMDNLFILSAGKKVPNHNELLGSNKMRQLVQQLKGQFDKILIDTPPLFLSDATQLARSADGVLLVVRFKYSGRKPVQEFVKDPILGPLTLGAVAIAPRDSLRYGYGNYGYNKYGYKRYGRRYGYGKYNYGKYGYSNYHEET